MRLLDDKLAYQNITETHFNDLQKGIDDYTRLKLILVSLGTNAALITCESDLEKDLLLNEHKREMFFEMAEAYLMTPIFYQESIQNINELLNRVRYARQISL